MNSTVIILASGQGKRLQPLTNRIHKSLVPINGVPNLVHTVRLAKESGSVSDIVVVTSPCYKSQFKKVIRKYNLDVHLIYNPKGCTTNNITSLQTVFNNYNINESVYIVDGDNYLTRNVFMDDLSDNSGFLLNYKVGVKEWAVTYKGKSSNQIREIIKDTDGYCMSGVSYWSGVNLSVLIRYVCQETDSSIYWEDVVINHLNQFESLRGHKSKDYSIEYDTVQDLINNKLMTPSEVIHKCYPHKHIIELNSMTNVNYLVGKSVVRLPGYGTDKFIDRSQEVAVTNLMSDAGLTPKTKFIGNDTVKISKYLSNYQDLRHYELTDELLASILWTLDKIHSQKSLGVQEVDLVSELDTYIRMTEQLLGSISHTSQSFSSYLNTVRDYLKEYQNHYAVLCHRDLVPGNILIHKSAPKVKFIDYEYSGFLNQFWDYGCLASEYELATNTPRQNLILKMADTYRLSGASRDLFIFLTYLWSGIVDYIWAAWGYARSDVDDNLAYGNQRSSKASLVFKLIGLERYNYEEKHNEVLDYSASDIHSIADRIINQ